MHGGAEIDAVQAAFALLRDALDKEDAAAILVASRQVREATVALQAHGAWHTNSDTQKQLASLVAEIESARIRVNVATDYLRRRIAVLADHGAKHAPLTYGR